MSLSEQESEVLENISEGITDNFQLENFTDFTKEKLKQILGSLEQKKLVTVKKKIDEVTGEELWDMTLTEEGEKLLK